MNGRIANLRIGSHRGVTNCRHIRLGSSYVIAHAQLHSSDGSPAPSEPSGPNGSRWSLVAGAAALAATTLLSSALLAAPAGAVTTEQLVFLDAWRAVDRAYVDKTFNGQNWFILREKYLKNESFDSREETYAAIRKLLASLEDPFTRFLDPEKLASVRRSSAGSVTGVGLELGYGEPSKKGDPAPIVVISPSAGGPADRAGVRPGDVIASVGGRPASGLSLYEVSDLLRGAEGTEVEVAVNRGGIKGPQSKVNLTRQKLKINPVSFAACGEGAGASIGGGDGRLGYIRLSTFNKQSAEAFRSAVAELRDQGVRRVVVDVRNNGGGLFPAAIEIGKGLIEKGDIVLIADNQGIRDIYSADGRGAVGPKDLAISVLVNKGTASASEVLAGALKDTGRAVIVGENTFGKGLIQTVIELQDGSGVAVTVAKYQTPGGVDINKIGVAPDIRLDTSAIPFEGEGFCKLAAGKGGEAPKLFK